MHMAAPGGMWPNLRRYRSRPCCVQSWLGSCPRAPIKCPSSTEASPGADCPPLWEPPSSNLDASERESLSAARFENATLDRAAAGLRRGRTDEGRPLLPFVEAVPARAQLTQKAALTTRCRVPASVAPRRASAAWPTAAWTSLGVKRFNAGGFSAPPSSARMGPPAPDSRRERIGVDCVGTVGVALRSVPTGSISKPVSSHELAPARRTRMA